MLDDVSLLDDSVCVCLHTIKENTEPLSEASRDVGVEINADKTKYDQVSSSELMTERENIRITNESFENVAKFK
jgi:hypothetical protein